MIIYKLDIGSTDGCTYQCTTTMFISRTVKGIKTKFSEELSNIEDSYMCKLKRGSWDGLEYEMNPIDDSIWIRIEETELLE